MNDLPKVEVHFDKIRVGSLRTLTFPGNGPFSVGQEILVQASQRPDALERVLIRESHLALTASGQRWILLVERVGAFTPKDEAA